MKKILFLDFDGVLINSVKEAFVVSTIAYGIYDNYKKVNFNSKFYEKFLRYRYLISSAWHYKYLLDFILDNKIEKINNFNTLSKELIDEKFEKKFFEVRNYLRENNFEYWLSLHKPYKFLFLIEKYLDKSIIVTTKDKESVSALLKKYVKYIPDIYDKEDFNKHKKKSEIIKNILLNEDIKEAIFVDDNKSHLSGLPINVKNFQANWGYNNKEGLSEEEILEYIERMF
jgi:FMN phosphatase YigB (HAD superfamily)